MLLVLDVGNTNITCGIYQGDSLIDIFRMQSDKTKQTKVYIEEIKKYTSKNVKLM